MNPFFSMMRQNPMFNFMRQVSQIRQNPDQLVNLLQQRGMINEQQAADIQRMGNDYEKIGQYLMNSGRIPQNLSQFENAVNQVQKMMK